MARGIVVLLAIGTFVPMGCHRWESDRLLVATSWPSAERLRIEAQFADWVAAARPAEPRTARLDWLILEPGDDPARLAARRDPPDILLGGPATSFDRLARTDRLAPLPFNDSPAWAVVRQARVRLAGPSPSPKEGRARHGQRCPEHHVRRSPRRSDLPGVGERSPGPRAVP